jgi:hypothetical protein
MNAKYGRSMARAVNHPDLGWPMMKNRAARAATNPPKASLSVLVIFRPAMFRCYA